jgi:hypothetical protein
LVVLRDHGARCSSLRLAGHEYEATQVPASQRHYRMGRADRGRSGCSRACCACGDPADALAIAARASTADASPR